MATIYRKTEKGQAEIETRAHRLAPRLRSSLIMVDGRRSTEELRKLIPNQPEESLAALVDQGFIEACATGTAARQADTAPQAGERQAPVVPDTRNPDHIRRLSVRLLNDLLGPAAEGMAIRLEKTRSAEEMRPLLETARQLIANARGASAAAEFATRVLAGH